tara:strand:- start:485 stop:1600 length:1116 start_codon:yes stop_codon:yes gene_type:complete
MEDYHKTVNAYAGQADKFQKFYTNYNTTKELSRLRDEGASRLASNAHDLAVSRAQSALGLSQEEAQGLTEQMMVAGTTGQATLHAVMKYRKMRGWSKKKGNKKGDGKEDGKTDDEERWESTPPGSPGTEGAERAGKTKVHSVDEGGEEVEGVDYQPKYSSLFGEEGDGVASADFGSLGEQSYGSGIAEQPKGEGRGLMEEPTREEGKEGDALQDEVSDMGSLKQDTTAIQGDKNIKGTEKGADIENAEETGGSIEGAETGAGENVAEGAGAELAEGAGDEVAVGAMEATMEVAPELIPLVLAGIGIGVGVKKIMGGYKANEQVANSLFVPPTATHSGNKNLPRDTIYSQSAEFTVPTYDSVTDIAPSVTAW